MAPDLVTDPRPATLRAHCPAELLATFARAAPAAHARMQTYAAHPATLAVTLLPDLAPDDALPVGSYLRTRHLAFPYAPGMDLGCGYAVWHLPHVEPEQFTPAMVGRLARRARGIPSPPTGAWLSAPAGENGALCKLETQLHAEVRLAAPGSARLAPGNHYLELHTAPQLPGAVLIVHNGGLDVSRTVQRTALRVAAGGRQVTSLDLPFLTLDARRPTGRAYARWAGWAQAFAREVRTALAHAVFEELGQDGLLWSDLMHSGVSLNGEIWDTFSGAQRLTPGLTAFIGGQVCGPGYLVHLPDGLDEAVISHGTSSLPPGARTPPPARPVLVNEDAPPVADRSFHAVDTSLHSLMAHGLVTPLARTTPRVSVKCHA